MNFCMRSFCQPSLLSAGEEATQLPEPTSYFAVFVSLFCGDSSFLQQISCYGQRPFCSVVGSRAELWGAWFSQLLFPIHNKIYIPSGIPLERFRVTGRLRLEGTSGAHLVQLACSMLGQLDWSEEYQQENKMKSTCLALLSGKSGLVSVTKPMHACLNIKHH